MIEAGICDELTFTTTLIHQLSSSKFDGIKAVTGPGRSGAVAAVYASHLLGVPFIPYGSCCPSTLNRLLIIDTAMMSGRTLRKATRKYSNVECVVHSVFVEPPRIRFWYELARYKRDFKYERTSM